MGEARRRAVVIFLLVTGPTLGWAAAETTTNPTPSAQKSIFCSADTTWPGEADNAVARGDFVRAEGLFRARLHGVGVAAEAQESRLGLVHALLGQNRIGEARTEANAWLAEAPASALAEVAAGEAAYRDADIAAAQVHASRAVADNRCEGRALALEAELSALGALFARQATLMGLAHRLRPNDEVIRREWIATLPAEERAVELARYLEESQNLSQSDRQLYASMRDRTRAHHRGECQASLPQEPLVLPMKKVSAALGDGDEYGLSMSFNGVNRRIVLDTGVAGILLSHATAKKLHLRPEYRIYAGGAGDSGRVSSYTAHVERIRIGGYEFHDCMVEVLEQTQLNSDGLIGPDVFAQRLVTIDYPNSEMRLEMLPPRPGMSTDEDDDVYLPHDRYVAPEMQDWMRMLRVGHLILVPAQLDAGPNHYFIVDSGSSQTTLSMALAKETNRAYANMDTHLSGLQGDIHTLYRVDGAVLHFGTFALKAQSYDAFDYTSILQQTGFEVSGLLGLPTLSSMTISIDYRDNLMQMTRGVRRGSSKRSVGR